MTADTRNDDSVLLSSSEPKLVERKRVESNNIKNKSKNNHQNQEMSGASTESIHNNNNHNNHPSPDNTSAGCSLLGGMPPTAILALNFVAVIWGTQHAVIKLVVDEGNAGPFTLLRFGIGAVMASAPLLVPPARQTKTEEEEALLEASTGDAEAGTTPASSSSSTTMDKNATRWTTTKETNVDNNNNNNNNHVVLRWGAEMGFWMFLGFAFQAIGLATTTAQRSGFLLYLNVKLVPFFAFFLLGRQISLPTWISALTAFCGTALLAYDGTSWSIHPGDYWSIAAAAASAMYILRLDVAAQAVGKDHSVQLNAACLWVVTILSGLWSLGSMQDPSHFGKQVMDILVEHPWELVYLSAVTTALANFIQTKSQKEVSAERASVIYAMDPVYGAFFSNLILGETLTNLGWVGAGMITVAAATNALLDLRPGSSSAADGAEEDSKRK